MPTKVQPIMPPPSRIKQSSMSSSNKHSKRQYTDTHQRELERIERAGKRKKLSLGHKSPSKSSTSRKSTPAGSSNSLLNGHFSHIKRSRSPTAISGKSAYQSDMESLPGDETGEDSEGGDSESDMRHIDNNDNRDDHCDEQVQRDSDEETVSKLTSVGQSQIRSVHEEGLLLKIRALEDQDKALRDRLAVMAEITNKKSKGKNKTRKKLDMSHADLLNCNAISTFMKDVFWRHFKFKLKNWNVFSNDKRSLCQMIMNVTTTPKELTEQQFWEYDAAPAANDKLCATASNYKEEVKKQFLSKCFFLYSGFVIIYY